MQSYVQRSLIGQAKAGEAADRKAERRYTQASPTAAAQMALSDTLNQSLRARAQTQLQRMLNQRPAVIAQMKLAETLSRRAMIQRGALPKYEELAQTKFEPAQRQGEALREAEEEETLQGQFEPVQRETTLDEDETLQGKFDSAQRQPGPERAQPSEPNRTGLPDNLKAGVEALSGFSLSDVRVHYNSSQPAQLHALAYAQGSDIHVGPGQERHLPHEAWHIVQQKQGRVKPTLQMKGVPINDAAALEREADVMGGKALQPTESIRPTVLQRTPHAPPRGGAFALGRYIHKQQANTPPAQLEGEEAFKDLTTGNDAKANTVVPDLPDNIVAEMEKKQKETKGRPQLLKDLYSHIAPQVVHPDLQKAITISYDTHRSDFGLYQPYTNHLGGVLTVYSLAFDTPSILYSTIRHELIHAEQFRVHQQVKNNQLNVQGGSDEKPFQPDVTQFPKPGSADAAVYQDSKNKLPTTDLEHFLSHGSEVETHAWEILHSGKTGIANTTFTQNRKTINFLANRSELLAVC